MRNSSSGIPQLNARKLDMRLNLQPFPILLLLPERLDGYYDFVCTQLQPHVCDVLVRPDLLENLKTRYGANGICDYFYRYFFPFLSEFAFTQAVLFLPHVLSLWDDKEHPFFARVAQVPDYQDNANYCSHLSAPRLQLAQKISSLIIKLSDSKKNLTQQNEKIFLNSNIIATAEDPVVFAESHYNDPQMIRLRQYLEMVPPHVIKENWRYQFTLGLMHLYSKNYSVAFKYFQEVQKLTDQYELTNFAKFSEYINGSDSLYKINYTDEKNPAIYPNDRFGFVHDLLAARTMQESRELSFVMLYFKLSRIGGFTSSGGSILDKPMLVTEALQQELEYYLAVKLKTLWKEDEIEIDPHLFTNIFTPKSRIVERLFNEYQALIQCLPTLLTCCRQGLVVPDFTYSLRKKIAKSAQGFLAAQVDDKANTKASDYFSSVLDSDLSSNKKDFTYSGTSLKLHTTSRLIWELLQLPLHLRVRFSEMYLSEMPLLAPEEVKQSYEYLSSLKTYRYRLENCASRNRAWHTARIPLVDSSSYSLATEATVKGIAEDYAASYPRELTCYSNFCDHMQEHTDIMLYQLGVSDLLHTAKQYVPLRGMQVNLNAYKDNIDYEIAPWLYHYVQQHLPQEVEQQMQSFKPSSDTSDRAITLADIALQLTRESKLTKSAKAAKVASPIPSLVPLQIELNNPLPINLHGGYYGCKVFFFPLTKSAHVKALMAGQLPEYQSIAYTPLQLQGYHQGELFAAESVSTRDHMKLSQKRGKSIGSIDSISLRYKILVFQSYNCYCDTEVAHYLLSATLGNTWMERHFGNMRIYEDSWRYEQQVEKYLSTTQNIALCQIFDYSLALKDRQFRSKTQIEADVAKATQELQELKKQEDAIVAEPKGDFSNRVRQSDSLIQIFRKSTQLNHDIKVFEASTGDFQWDAPFYITMKDLHLLKSLPSWQQFFGYYDHTHLYYNYTLHGLQWPKSKTVEEKTRYCGDPKIDIKDINVKEWFLLPDFDHDLDLEQYQQLCATYPWREDIYFGRTACYRMLATYHQGNRATEDYLSQYLRTDYRLYPVDSLSRLMQLHAFAGFIMVPTAQLAQGFAQGLGTSTTLATSDMVSSEALAALPIDAKFYGQAQKLWEQRQIEQMSGDSNAAANDAATSGDSSTAIGATKKPKKARSKQIKSTDGQNTMVTVEVGRIAYYLSFLQDLQRTLKQELGTEIDVIGYALGTKYVYLDLITWDWELFLKKAMPLEQSELAGRYGVSDFVFHSFFRACDALPLTSLTSQ